MQEQIDIFASAARPTLHRTGDLPDDFVIVPDFLSKAEEHELLLKIDAAPWNLDMKRRVQQYGYRYDYKARAVSDRDRIEDLPDWAFEISQRLIECNYFDTIPDQVIINEYEPGQGISPHTDRTSCFGPTVASLSLGSDIVMDFIDDGGKSGAVMLPRCSMLVLRGSSRARWRHGIAQRRRDIINAETFTRKRRVSLTFRVVVIAD
jgi:alkylated DNA repair dioxygenase AlkB